MKNMSFSLTTKQILAREKTVTRRLNWKHLREGEMICAVKKGMGLKKGEKLERLSLLRIKRVSREPLRNILGCGHEVIAEGFPKLTTQEFISMFCQHMKCCPDTIITRIEFAYIDHSLWIEDHKAPISDQIEEAIRRGIQNHFPPEIATYRCVNWDQPGEHRCIGNFDFTDQPACSCGFYYEKIS